MAPVPARERMKRYRERMNNEKKEGFRKKDREKHRVKRSMRTCKQLEDDRWKSKSAMQLLRKKRSEGSTKDLDRRFKVILSVPETHKMHYFCTVQKGTVEINRTSKINGTIFNFKANDSIFSKKEKNDDSQPAELNKVSIGHWVVFRFPHENSSRTKDFIGQVTSVVNNSAYIVLFTKKCGKNLFLFLEVEDKVEIEKNSIVGYLDEPQINSRLQMTFPNCLKIYNL